MGVTERKEIKPRIHSVNCDKLCDQSVILRSLFLIVAHNIDLRGGQNGVCEGPIVRDGF